MNLNRHNAREPMRTLSFREFAVGDVPRTGWGAVTGNLSGRGIRDAYAPPMVPAGSFAAAGSPCGGDRIYRDPNRPEGPLDPALIRAKLDSPNPAVALAVALVAFHGLTGKQVRELRLTEIVDGRLHLDGRDIPLAAPVRSRLRAWLDHRNRTWPATANPHLLIN